MKYRCECDPLLVLCSWSGRLQQKKHLVFLHARNKIQSNSQNPVHHTMHDVFFLKLLVAMHDAMHGAWLFLEGYFMVTFSIALILSMIFGPNYWLLPVSIRRSNDLFFIEKGHFSFFNYWRAIKRKKEKWPFSMKNRSFDLRIETGNIQ